MLTINAPRAMMMGKKAKWKDYRGVGISRSFVVLDDQDDDEYLDKLCHDLQDLSRDYEPIMSDDIKLWSDD